MRHQAKNQRAFGLGLLTLSLGLGGFGACAEPGGAGRGAGSGRAADAAPSNERRGIGALSDGVDGGPVGGGDTIDGGGLDGVNGGGGLAIPSVIEIDPRRSLAVTDQAIVDQFSLQAVLGQLAAQSGVPGATALGLFRQLWDTQNDAATSAGLSEPCTGSLNGFPYACPRSEGVQAQQDPFADPAGPEAYRAIGLFNRFDLAPADGSNCGEHRIVFARRSGEANPVSRSLLIFEAVLDNPHRSLGLEGCAPVAAFWAALSLPGVTVQQRATALTHFYFQGLPGFQPVVHVDNYGNPVAGRQTGQIRSNQFLSGPGEPWMLREFRLVRSCSAGACELEAVPDTVKVNPSPELFADAVDGSDAPIDQQRRDFQSHFLTQLGGLATPDVDLFNYSVPDRFNPGESQSQGTRDDYAGKLGPAFAQSVQAALDAQGIALTSQDVVNRSLALSCGGCHQVSNNRPLGGGLGNWPASQGFTHVSERDPEPAPEGGLRFRISPALTGTFLPHRKAVLESFLSAL
ncbi:MAG TPA: hypothetical protein VFS43_42330 [Polyangiaceae bacterium]|nr:hypothetical protein [Polyangiaceae bacterium]